MKVRVDKWLWSVRLFKSRSIASRACKAGRIKLGDRVLKASYEISEGDLLHVHKDGFYFRFKVLKLIGKRVSATLARPCYDNSTPEEELRKYDSWYVGKGGKETRERGSGRPTKRERREIEVFKSTPENKDFNPMAWEDWE